MNRLMALCMAACLIALISTQGVYDAHARDAAQDRLDPVVVSPGMNRVLLENEHVRVVEYRIAPGETDNWHTHPAKVSYVVEPGRLRITTGDDQSFEVDEDAGTARWLGPVGIHRGTNVGETPIKIVYVEIKSVQEQGDALRQFLKEESDTKPSDPPF